MANKLKELLKPTKEMKENVKKMIKEGYDNKCCSVCENCYLLDNEEKLPGVCTIYEHCKLGGFADGTCENFTPKRLAVFDESIG